MKIKVEANACFKEVDHSKKRYIVMKGSAGSGKSMDTAQNYIIRLMNDPGRNLLCVRKADVTNRDSTFAELQSAIFRMFGESYKKYWYINTSNMLLECKNNHNQIIFRGVNDEKQREKLKSITFKRGKLTDVWVEEATEITQSDFEIIDDRLRGILPKGLFYQIRLTFNPVSSHHWIKKVFFDRVDPDVLTHQSTYENNRFIDEAYHRRMLRRKEVDYLKQHMIHIHPSCVNTIKEIQQWKWKKDERTNTYLEEPVPFFDDAMAMLRYSIEEERKAKPKLNRNLKGGL